MAITLPTRAAFAAHHLEVCRAYLGVSRDTNRPQVERFLGLYGLPFERDGKPLPFCDAGLGYAGCKALCDLIQRGYVDNPVAVLRSVITDLRRAYFFASASCYETKTAAVGKGTWLGAEHINNDTVIKPGWLVLYSWKDGPEPDHIEIVESDGGDVINTIGFNTSDANAINGGAVARKARSWVHILGFIQTW